MYIKTSHAGDYDGDDTYIKPRLGNRFINILKFAQILSSIKNEIYKCTELHEILDIIWYYTQIQAHIVYLCDAVCRDNVCFKYMCI